MYSLSVFTLNIWGIGAGLSADRKPRVLAIANHIASSSYHIVLLQEVWVPEDYETIRRITKSEFPYAHFFDNGTIGSGTCVLSKHVIQDTTFHEFSLNGYPHKISHGDWFAGKGLGVCQILCQDLIINVFLSHLHAEYSRRHDVYLGHRVMQALEAAQWIKLTSAGADLTIYAGDFNTEPTDVPYTLLRHVGCLEDAWIAANGDTQGGETNATPYNTYTTAQEKIESPMGKRIDYILYSAGPNMKVSTSECKLPLPTRIPSSLSAKEVSYSDHEGVCATLKIEDVEEGPSARHLVRHKSSYCEDRHRCVRSGIELVKKALSATKYDRFFYLGSFIVLFALFLASFTTFFLTDNYIVDSIVFVCRFALTLSSIYVLFMGTIFNRKEKNALLSAKASLELIVSESKYKSM